MKHFLLIIAITCLLVNVYAQQPDSKIMALDQYIEQARQEWQVPGLAVAVVQNGKTLLNKGYGVKQLGREEKVDEQTLFANASTTKAMTALAMGILVDEGKVDWEDKVVQHLPEFQLSDPYVTSQLRVKDLFTHNAGLGNADFLWVYNDLTSDEILYQMRYLKMSYPFRGGYTYQNIMYLAAGKLIEKLSGMPWSDFMTQRVFQVVGMHRTFPLRALAAKEKNLSSPHHYVNNEIVPIKDTDADAIGPAGSVWSCTEDMVKWMKFLLDSTKVEGRRVLQPETYAELFRPQINIPRERFYVSKELTKPHWTTYALGWFQHDYNGRFVSFHTGSLGGTVAIHGLLPDENLGVFVYGNLDHAEVRHAIMYKVFDLFGGKSADIDWSKALLAIYNKLDEESASRREQKMGERVLNTQPDKPLEAYTGTYSDRFFGKAEVMLEEGALQIKLTSQTVLKLEHWHYNTFLGHWNRPWNTPSFVQFNMDVSGNISTLEVDGMSFSRN